MLNVVVHVYTIVEALSSRDLYSRWRNNACKDVSFSARHERGICAFLYLLSIFHADFDFCLVTLITDVGCQIGYQIWLAKAKRVLPFSTMSRRMKSAGCRKGSLATPHSVTRTKESVNIHFCKYFHNIAIKFLRCIFICMKCSRILKLIKFKINMMKERRLPTWITRLWFGKYNITVFELVLRGFLENGTIRETNRIIQISWLWNCIDENFFQFEQINH